jgi:hypothetical protein
MVGLVYWAIHRRTVGKAAAKPAQIKVEQGRP